LKSIVSTSLAGRPWVGLCWPSPSRVTRSAGSDSEGSVLPDPLLFCRAAAAAGMLPVTSDSPLMPKPTGIDDDEA
jgi:hypothetical protein